MELVMKIAVGAVFALVLGTLLVWYFRKPTFGGKGKGGSGGKGGSDRQVR